MADVSPFIALVTGLSKYPPKAFQTKLVAYFQSKKKSGGGGECSVSVLDNGDALVTFHKEEVLKSVLAKTHKVTIEGKDIPISVSRYEGKGKVDEQIPVQTGNVGEQKPVQKGNVGEQKPVQTLSIEVQEESGRSTPKIPYTPEKGSQEIPDETEKMDLIDSSRIYFEIVNDDFDQENLEFIIECCSGTKEFKIFETNDTCKAVVEFSGITDVRAVVEKVNSKQRKNVKAQMLKRSRSIQITQLPAKIHEDHLELYFESKIVGNGGVEVTTNQNDHTAVITFPQPEDVLEVMSKPHAIKGQDLKIHLYFEEMQLTVFTSKEDKEHIVHQKSSKAAEPQSTTVTEECPLKNEHYFQILKQHNIESEHPEVQLNFDTGSKNVVTITGLPGDVTNVQLKFLKIASQIESKIWQTVPYCCVFLAKVEKEDFIKNVFLNSGINATYSCSEDQIRLYAASDEDLTKAEQALNATVMKTEVIIPEDFTAQDDLSRFLTEAKKSLIQKHSEWNIIKGETLQYNFISLADGGTANRVELVGYKNLIIEAQKVFEDYLEKNCITKIFFPVRSAGALECLQRFVDFQSILLESAKTEFEEEEDSFGLHVYINSIAASQTREIIADIIKQIVAEERKLQKPGAAQFIEKHKPVFKSLETTYQCVIHIEGNEDKAVSIPTSATEEEISQVILHEKFKVSIIKHSVAFQDADAILLPVDVETLEYSSKLSKMITDAGGPQLQETMKGLKRKEKLVTGNVYVTSAGQLTAKQLIHVIIPKWNETEEKKDLLKKSLVGALNTANSKGFRSIAIHPFDFEKSKPSLQCYIHILMMSIKEFCDAKNSSYVELTNIRLVTLNDGCISAMKSALQIVTEPASGTSKHDLLLKLAKTSAEKDASSTSFHLTEPAPKQQPGKEPKSTIHGKVICSFRTPEDIDIYLVKGNIGLQKCDVIVNTVSTALNLTYGAVSKAILDQAGYELQENTNQVKPATEVKHGAVIPVSTRGCKIACKEVYNTVCCHYENDNTASSEKILEDIIKECLEKAHTSGYQSIAFPAIGTGNLRFPKSMVAEKFIKEIKEFGKTYKTTALKIVNIVVYEKDRETLKAFDYAILAAKGIPQHELDQYSYKYDSDEEMADKPPGQAPRLGHAGQVQMKDATDCYPHSSEHHDEKLQIMTTLKNVKLIIKCGDAQNEPADAYVEYSGQDKKNVRILGKHKSTIKVKPGALLKPLAKALDICEDKQFQTVCISIPRSLPAGISLKTCVSNLVKTVGDFAENYPSSSVTCVKLIGSSPEILTVFKEDINTKSQKSGSIWSSFWKLFSGSGTAVDSSPPTEDEVSVEDGDIVPVIFKLYSLKNENIEKAWNDIQHLLRQEYTSRDVPIALDMFSEEERTEIKQFSKDVIIRFNEDKNCIIIEGAISQICEVQDKIITLSRTLEKKRNEEQKDKYLQEKVCWKFWNDGKWNDFNCRVNACLERAYQSKEKETIVEIEGQYIVFDMENKKVKDGSHTRICCRKTSDEIPDIWESDDADIEGKYREVPLLFGTSEYQEVCTNFFKTMDTAQAPNTQVLEIRRIENPSLWRLYIARRNEMNRQRQSQQNESILYHGTNSNICGKINADGFNRSYCGKNAVVWGDGTYFATAAWYSADNTYSVPDSGTGDKWMYRARVLTGEFCQGARGLIEPPLKDPSGKSPDRYDSVANKLVKPDLFVIFQDNQAYPEYLIKFKVN